jgi:hypothetical protein
MSKHSDSSAEDLNYLDEVSLEPVIEQGPTPAIAPLVGTIAKVLTRYTHCEICAGRLHFNYISDFSRNTTHEKSSCPECGLDARQVLHRLQ